MSFVYNFYQYFTPNGVDMQTNLFKKMCPHNSPTGGNISKKYIFRKPMVYKTT